MNIGRLSGKILLVAAFVFAAAEVAAQGVIGQFRVLGAVEVLDILLPEFLDWLIVIVRDGIHPLAWDPGLRTIMALPGWLLAGGPGIALAWRFRIRPIGGDERDPPSATYEDIAVAAAEEAKLHSRKPSKYEFLEEYDLTKATPSSEDLMVFDALEGREDDMENNGYNAWPHALDEENELTSEQEFDKVPIDTGHMESSDGTAKQDTARIFSSDDRPVNSNAGLDKKDPQF